ncbi:MAG TPA: YHYH protein [Gaiellaceae bacterium]|nr:YHYH protein [Gaiellaceae bacterium]
MRRLVIAIVVTGAVGTAAALAAVDPTKLPLGDGKVTTSGPKRGWVYACQPARGGQAPTGPWIQGSTWDSTQKVAVSGSVKWRSTTAFRAAGRTLRITGNALPRHTTGIYPISSSDPAYQYDRNPNSIRAQTLAYSLPAQPKVASKPRCVSGGTIGVMLTGSVFFNALDANGFDAVAHEIQDRCGGHPAPDGRYHYHSLSPCAAPGTSTTAHSKLVGYALDGFGIYGKRGLRGKPLTNADLDACHGHTHTITWRGKRTRMFHYHATLEYPYTVGCFRATPVHTGPGG